MRPEDGLESGRPTGLDDQLAKRGIPFGRSDPEREPGQLIKAELAVGGRLVPGRQGHQQRLGPQLDQLQSRSLGDRPDDRGIKITGPDRRQ